MAAERLTIEMLRKTMDDYYARLAEERVTIVCHVSEEARIRVALAGLERRTGEAFNLEVRANPFVDPGMVYVTRLGPTLTIPADFSSTWAD